MKQCWWNCGVIYCRWDFAMKYCIWDCGMKYWIWDWRWNIEDGTLGWNICMFWVTTISSRVSPYLIYLLSKIHNSTTKYSPKTAMPLKVILDWQFRFENINTLFTLEHILLCFFVIKFTLYVSFLVSFETSLSSPSIIVQ